MRARWLWRLLHSLALGLVGLGYLSTAQASDAPATAAGPSTEVWYVMDREGWLRTDDARLVLTTYDLRNGPNLAAVPLQLGDWTGQDLPVTNLETFPTLNADHLVYRGYTNSAGRMLILSLVGSTRGQSFHHPLICYAWASWPAEDRGTVALPVGDSDVVLRYVVGYDPEGPAQVDLHWYLWPNDRRDWGDGATQVRVTALATVSEEQALADAREFAQLLFAAARRLDAPAEAPEEPAVAPSPDQSAEPLPAFSR